MNFRLFLLLLIALPFNSVAETPEFRISVEQSGVYRVAYEDLPVKGIHSEPISSRGLGLFVSGETVPIWVEDGGDGVFGPGDWFEFVAERLSGDQRYSHDYSRWNIYWLKLDRQYSHRMNARSASVAEADAHLKGQLLSLRSVKHFEEDKLFIRIAGFEIEEASPPELWYWAKLTHLDKQPLSMPLDLTDLDPGSPAGVTLTLSFRGLSFRDTFGETDIPDHWVEVYLNGSELALAQWDGREDFLLNLPDLESSGFNEGENELAIKIPQRVSQDGKNPMIDVVVLDWIEVSYPRAGQVTGPQTALRIMESHVGGQVRVSAPAADHMLVYASGGSRVATTGTFSTGGTDQQRQKHLVFETMGADVAFHVVVDGQFMSPALIRSDVPSQLRVKDQAYDYLMIAHESLIDAVRPLAEFHRRRGLRVVLVDVQDVYDEFNYGIVHPRAIRDFIDYSYRNWLKPAPRFVLLVGDASWDTKNTTVDDANYANWTNRQIVRGDRFHVKNTQVYDEGAELNSRNLIPTWNYHSNQGHSASDNWYVALGKNDHLPVMAIGRLPLTKPEEVQAVVEKTIRYVEQPQLGPWRRNSLWITNEELGFQQATDLLATQASENGLGLQKVYPQPEESGNISHQVRLREAFDDGQFLVHFLGHGGRFIWRTGPPDIEKNHDLFTLDDLEQLKPNNRLAVVLSMTCFSGPFDHPNADSIGEKFLRMPDRGAVGVLAASWRTQPSGEFSRILLEELTMPGTLGEAILRAKQRIRDPGQVEPYNLLGDPAVPLAIPQLTPSLTAQWSRRGALSVRVDTNTRDFKGRAVVDWQDRLGNTLVSQEHAVSKPGFKLRFGGSPGELQNVRYVRVYVWSTATAIDGIARQLVLPPG